MANNHAAFMDAISGLGLTLVQLESASNLYKIMTQRPKINGQNIGDVVNEVNDRMDSYMDYIGRQPHTKDEFFAKVNKKWMELRDQYHLNVPENNWFDVDLHAMVHLPTIKDFSAGGDYSNEERRYDADAQAKAWLNMMFTRRDKNRSDFGKYLQWERDCLRYMLMSRGSGISTYGHDVEMKAALSSGDVSDLIQKYCLQKAAMHPLIVGLESATNADAVRKYADLSNRMAYIEDVKFNGKIPPTCLTPPTEVWFGWHRMPGGKKVFTMKRFGRDSDMFSKTPLD